MKQVSSDMIDKVTAKGKTAIIFSAEWCGPCKPLKNNVSEAQKRADFKAYEMDAEKEDSFASMLGVAGLPTTVVYKDGELIDGFTGVKPEHEIADFIKRI